MDWPISRWFTSCSLIQTCRFWKWTNYCSMDWYWLFYQSKRFGNIHWQLHFTRYQFSFSCDSDNYTKIILNIQGKYSFDNSFLINMLFALTIVRLKCHLLNLLICSHEIISHLPFLTITKPQINASLFDRFLSFQ